VSLLEANAQSKPSGEVTTAAVLHAPGSIATDRLDIEERELPALRSGQILVTVRACGVCRTDLNIVEGDLKPRHATIVPGHQIVGTVEAVAPGVELSIGMRVGISWLGGVDGTCRFCLDGRENLCDEPVFTGYDVDGGYATAVIARADFAYLRGHHRLPRAARRRRSARRTRRALRIRLFRAPRAADFATLGMHDLRRDARR
jgi:propanol-preferring alcohol dehydrogenase